MKDQFLELAKKVNTAGIVEALSKTSSKEEMSEVWQKFMDENQDLCTKIKEWANEFRESDPEPIFTGAEQLEHPIEITAVIHIIDDEDVSECEIFEDWKHLMYSVREIGTAFAVAVANCIENQYICKMKAKDIFKAYEKSEENDSDAESETANEEKCGEDTSEIDGEDNPGKDATDSGEEAH